MFTHLDSRRHRRRRLALAGGVLAVVAAASIGVAGLARAGHRRLAFDAPYNSPDATPISNTTAPTSSP